MHPPSSSEGRSSSHRKVAVVITVITICRSRGDRDQDQHKAWGPKRSSPTLLTKQLNHSIPSSKVLSIPCQTPESLGTQGRRSHPLNQGAPIQELISSPQDDREYLSRDRQHQVPVFGSPRCHYICMRDINSNDIVFNMISRVRHCD